MNYNDVLHQLAIQFSAVFLIRSSVDISDSLRAVYIFPELEKILKVIEKFPKHHRHN